MPPTASPRRITLPDGRTLDVRIPRRARRARAAVEGPGRARGRQRTAGDALVEVSIAPHPYFVREGDDIIVDLPVTMQEAVLGASLEVPTISGKVRLAIPPRSGSGTRLRLPGADRRGPPVVDLPVVLPPADEPALVDFLRGWTPVHPFDPRDGMEGP